MSKKKLIQLILLFVISGFFLYLTFNDLDYKKTFYKFNEFNFFFLPLAFFLAFISLYLRSLRWGFILGGIVKISQKKLFPISSVGFLAITILPFRAGEIVRPYLLSRSENIPFTSTLTTIFIERALDIIMLLTILFFIVIFSEVPNWVLVTGFILLGALIFAAILTFVIFKTEGIINRFVRKLSVNFPEKFKLFIKKFMENLFIGLSVLSKPKELIKVLSLSFALWFVFGMIVYVMFFFHSFDLSIFSSYSVMSITFLGTLVPAAPGFVGTFQYANSVALSIYGASPEDAALFSITYYLVVIGTNIIVGLIFLPFINLDKKTFNKIYDNSKAD